MKTPERFNLCVCVCACVCVCVCVCGSLSVCLFLYSFTVKTSSVCKVPETCLRGMDQQFCVVSIIPGASAKFPRLHFIFHFQRWNSSTQTTGDKTIWYMVPQKIDLYWYRYMWATQQTDKWRKDTKDKEATLICILPLWVKSLELAKKSVCSNWTKLRDSNKLSLLTHWATALGWLSTLTTRR